jgi:dipeptidyl aminopeptidase/acylaminoacyl peptidase
MVSPRSIVAAAAAFVALLFGAAATAQTNVELIPRANFFGNPSKTQALISPDGKWLSWLAPKDGVMNVWVAPIANPRDAKAITSEKTRPIRNHFWAENSKLVLYVNDRGGDENFLLYGADPVSGETKLFTPYEKTRVIPIGGSLVRRNEVLIGLNNRDPRFHDVWLLDLTTGKLTLVYENHEFGGFLADDSLALRFALKEKAGGAQDILRFSDGKTEPFATIPAEDSLTTQPLGMTRDGKTLYWFDSRGRDKIALVSQALPDGAPKVIGESAKADVSGIMTNPRTGVAEAYSVTYLNEAWTPIIDSVKADVAALNGRIKGNWEVVSRNEADTLWVVQADEIVKPVSYYLYERKGRKLTELFVTRPELAGKPLAPMYGVEIKARDGLVLPSFLTLPVGTDSSGRGRPDQPLPLLLNVHGGPWAQDTLRYHPEAQWAANRGYATLQVNYRGSSGFGKRFIESATHEFAGKMHDDLVDAVKWAIDNKITTADKIAIYGGSYGGYATLVGMTFTPTTFACGVDIVGPSNLVTLIDSFPDYWKPFLEGTWYRRVGNPANPEDRKELLARSPLTRAADIQRPLLIAQGANDPRVTQKESDQLAAAMTAKNIPVTYVLYADEGHGFARPENRISFYAISEAFLGKCLGGRAEPIGASFTGANLSIKEGASFVPGLAAAVPASTTR